jgi:hypothetical protein
MTAQDFSVLLSLMQSGAVARLKKGLRSNEEMTTWVFAGANRKDRLPPELLSRFNVFNFKPSVEQEFIEVGVAVITQQLGKDSALAEYVAKSGAAESGRAPGGAAGQADGEQGSSGPVRSGRDVGRAESG